MRISVTNPNTAPAVLLVEDEALICEMVRDMLCECGFAVHAVTNAADALLHLAGAAPVDVLFTDINLPGGMDGAALAAKAREMRPGLPVVFASGRWSLLENLAALPNSAVLRKPYSLSQACRLVENLLPAMQKPQDLASGAEGR